MKFPLHFSKFILTTIVLMFCSSHAYAIGLGFVTGGGYENWKVNDDVEGSDPGYHGDRRVANFGFVLDTRVRKDTLVGYRLTIRGEQNKGGKIDMRGLTATHDLTFGLIRTNSMRLWIGQEIKTTSYIDLSINSEVVSEDELGSVLGFGVGPIVGLNIHLQNSLSFSFTAAILETSYTGETDYYSRRDGKRYGDLHVNSRGLYINAEIVFRLNE